MKSNYIVLRIATVFSLLLCFLFVNDAHGQNQCVSLDGNGDYIEIDADAIHRMSPNVTVEAWIKPSANTTYAGIANSVWHTGGEQSGYGLLMGGSTTYVYFVVATTGNAIQYLPGNIGALNVWKHVAGTYDGSTMRLYVNGTEVNTYSVSGSIDYTYQNQFRIGRYFDDGEEVYDYTGLIDEVRLWNVVRTPEQLRQYDSTELAGTETGLIGYWKLNDGSGLIAQDGTTNDNDGTLWHDAGWVGETGMPVELTSFTAVAKGKGVELAWQTATEVNNHGFAIERKQIPLVPSGHSPFVKGETSEASGGFEQVGFVEGHGTTNIPKTYSFTDAAAKDKVVYRLKQIDNDGKFVYSKEVEVTISQTPQMFALMQNHPNPFNPTTEIRYQMSEVSRVSLKIHDMLGREVATLVNEVKEAGEYTAEFNASQYTSGIYFYTLRTNNFTATKKMLMIK